MLTIFLFLSFQRMAAASMGGLLLDDEFILIESAMTSTSSSPFLAEAGRNLTLQFFSPADPNPNHYDYLDGPGWGHGVGENFNGSTGETIHFSIGFQVIIYVIYNMVFVAALLGNTLVCYVVFSSPRMRTVTNYLIANLAVGDLLMAILCVPFSYISVLLQYWPFGQLLCHLVSPAQATCVFVSAYTLVALAGDRYVAILYPLKPRLRRSQAVCVIFLVWTIAIITSMPIAVFTGMTYNRNGLPECQEVSVSSVLCLCVGEGHNL